MARTPETVDRLKVMSDDPNFLYTENQVAELMGYKPTTLRIWRFRGEGPPFVEMNSKRIRYRKGDLDKWIKDRVRKSSAEKKSKAKGQPFRKRQRVAGSDA